MLIRSAGDKTVIVLDPQTGNLLNKLEGHDRFVTSCAFNSDSTFIATGSNDKNIIIWPFESMKDKNYIVFNADDVVVNEENMVNSGNLIKSGSVVNEWTVDDVEKWLERTNLKKYISIFRTNSIDGSELLHLTQDALLTSLQIGI